MTFRPMESVHSAPRRLPEQGRIRLGQLVAMGNGKTRPDKLSTLRFTSPHQGAIAAIAALHGGDVRPWENEWQVVTDTAEIAIVLPPDPLGETPIYEMWAKGSLQRRCDGETVVCPKRVSNTEVAMETSPCICNRVQQADCKPTTRLAVILPDIPFGGVWRLDTHSWNAADELPGMVAAIQSFTARGFVRAYLGVRQETKIEAGKKKEFIVPYLRMDTSVQQALDGAAGLAALPVGSQSNHSPIPAAEIEAPKTMSAAEAKHRLLAALDGDTKAAQGLWTEWKATRFGPDCELVTVNVADVEALLELAIPTAEVVEDGEPF